MSDDVKNGSDGSEMRDQVDRVDGGIDKEVAEDALVGQISKPCDTCGTIFYKRKKCSPSQWELARFCSRRCVNQQKSREMIARWAAMSAADRKAFALECSKRTTRQMADPKARAHLSRVVAERHKKEGYKARFAMTPEIRAKISASQKGKRRAWMDDEQRNADARAANRRAQVARIRAIGLKNHELFRPDVRQRAIERSVEDGKINPLRGKFETNCHAGDWHLRDPEGREYHFRNLRHFIRNHNHLFSARQLEVVGPGGRTRVEGCLAGLSPRKQLPTTCSQGWTWVQQPGELDPRLISASAGGEAHG